MQKREKIGIRTSLMFDEKLKILKFSQHVATQTWPEPLVFVT